MEIKRMEGVELTLVNQNSPKNESKKCKHGVMEQRGSKRYVFTEEIPRRRPQPNPRVYDGHYLSMTCNKRGQHMVYVKGEVPKAPAERKEWTIGVYGDLSAAIEHLAE